MKEEELNELVKEHYGFTIDEIDEDIGKLSLRVNQLEYNNKKLQEENKSLQFQLKAKEEVIKEAREVINKMIYTGYLVENGATAIQYMPTGKKTEFYPRAKIIDEILSKGENK